MSNLLIFKKDFILSDRTVTAKRECRSSFAPSEGMIFPDGVVREVHVSNYTENPMITVFLERDFYISHLSKEAIENLGWTIEKEHV